MRRKVHYRYKSSDMDLKSDCMYVKERLKGENKQNFKRCTRRRLKRETEKQIKGR